MTIFTTNDKTEPYVTNGARIDWPFNFHASSASELVLTYASASGSVTTVTGDELTVLPGGIGNPDGGVVRYPNTGAALASGGTVVVSRLPEFIQDARLRGQERYDPTTIENQLDDIVKMAQFLKRKIDAAAVINVTDDDVSNELPPYQAENLWIWSAVTPKKLENISPTNLAARLGLETQTLPFYTYEDMQLTADGETDDSIKFNKFIKDKYESGIVSAAIVGDPTRPIRLDNLVTVYSNWAVNNVRANLGKGGGFQTKFAYAHSTDENHPKLSINGVAGQNYLFIDDDEITSTRFPVGAIVDIEGKTSGTGSSLERQTTVVSAVDDITKKVTFEDNLLYDYQISYPAGDYENTFGVVDETYVKARKSYALTANTVIGEQSVTVSSENGSQMTADTLVMIEDKELSASGYRVNRELNKIKSISSGTIGLVYPLQRVMTTANSATISVIDGSIGVGFFNVAATDVETADPAPASRVHALNIQPGENCIVENFNYSSGVFGRRGAAIRDEGLNSKIDDPVIGPATETASGDGYGIDWNYCRGSKVRGGVIESRRHEIISTGSTSCSTYGVTIVNPLLSAIDHHGRGDIDSAHYNPIIIGGTVGLGSNVTAVKCGNPTHRSYSRDIHIHNMRVDGFDRANMRVIRADPGSDNIRIDGGEFRNIERFLYWEKFSGTTEVTGAVEIDGIIVDTASNMLFEVVRDLGQTGNLFERLSVSNIVTRGCDKLFDIDSIDEVEIRDNTHYLSATGDDNDPYVIKAANIPALRITEIETNGGNKGFSLTTCPDFHISKIEFNTLNGTEIFADGGDNDNGYLGPMDIIGFIPTWGSIGATTTIDYDLRVRGALKVYDSTPGSESDITSTYTDVTNLDSVRFEVGAFEQGSAGAFKVHFPCIVQVIADYSLTHNVDSSNERFLKFRVANADESVVSEEVIHTINRAADTTAAQLTIDINIPTTLVGVDLFLQVASGATSLTTVVLTVASMTVIRIS